MGHGDSTNGDILGVQAAITVSEMVHGLVLIPGANSGGYFRALWTAAQHWQRVQRAAVAVHRAACTAGLFVRIR